MASNLSLLATGVACFAFGALAIQTPIVGSLLGNEAGGVNEAQVQRIIGEYLDENPEKIVMALQNMQRRAFEEEQANAQQALEKNLSALTEADSSPSIGTGESGVTVVEFFDYQCGYCKRMTPIVQQLVEAHPDVKVVFKEYPILSDNSQKASASALAVHQLAPKRYHEFHTMLMNHRGEYTESALLDYAGQLGVDAEKFKEVSKSEAVLKEIQRVNDLAKEIGVRGTPALIVGGELIPGAVPFEELDKRVRSLKDKS